MSFTDSNVMVSISDIADIAQVKRAAASNWPKRHRDFPKPRLVTSTGALYDAREAERWLIEKDKISGPIPAEVRLGRVADRLREQWSPEDIADYLTACVVYLHGASLSGDPLLEWETVRKTPFPELPQVMNDAGTELGRQFPVISGVIENGLDQTPPPEGALLAQTIDLIHDSLPKAYPIAVLEDACIHVRGWDRYVANETHVDIAQLIDRLAGPVSGTVFDPACGVGGLFWLTLVHPAWEDLPYRIVGFDTEPKALRLAQARCFLNGMTDARFEDRDTLRDAGALDLQADMVLLDPPFRQRDWGDADLYVDRQIWRYGLVPPRSADFAWVQVAVESLKPDGKAFVVLPVTDAAQGHREGEVRRALVTAGCVECVIFLPQRLSRVSGVQECIWVLRRPDEERPDRGQKNGGILLVDATGLTSVSPILGLDEGVLEEVVSVFRIFDETLLVDSPIAICVQPDELGDDANLSFWAHQPLPPAPSVEHLRERSLSGRRRLQSASQRLADDVDSLRDLLERSS